MRVVDVDPRKGCDKGSKGEQSAHNTLIITKEQELLYIVSISQLLS